MTRSNKTGRFWRTEPGSIKICGLTSVEDTQVVVDAGADAVGLNFYPQSKRFVTTDEASVVAQPARGRSAVVGIFVNADPQRVVEVSEALTLDAVQLHGDESPEITNWIRERVSGLIIKAFVAGSKDLAHAGDWGCDPILVDAETGGSGKTYDWDLLAGLPPTPRVFMAGGLRPSNVGGAIAAAQPWGVDVASGVESVPGRKDPDLVRDFVETARRAFGRPIATAD